MKSKVKNYRRYDPRLKKTIKVKGYLRIKRPKKRKRKIDQKPLYAIRDPYGRIMGFSAKKRIIRKK